MNNVCVCACRLFTILPMQGCLWVDQVPQGSFVWRSTTTTLSLYLVHTVHMWNKNTHLSPNIYCHTCTLSFSFSYTHTHTSSRILHIPLMSAGLIFNTAIHLKFSRYTFWSRLYESLQTLPSLSWSDLTIRIYPNCFLILYTSFFAFGYDSVNHLIASFKLSCSPTETEKSLTLIIRITATLVCSVNLIWIYFVCMEHFMPLFEGWQ